MRLSAMSVSRVLAASADQPVAGDLPPLQVVDEHGRVVDFTSELERWRMRRGNPGDQI